MPSSHAASARRGSVCENAMPAIHSEYAIQYGLPSSRATATDSSVSASASSVRPADWSPST